MPTYHYRGIECGHEFEEWQKITDPPLDKCRECGGPAERVISGGAGLLFKGNGFYITDYRSAGYKKDANKEKPAVEKKADAPKKDSGTGSTKDS